MPIKFLSVMLTSTAVAASTCGAPNPPSLTGSGQRWAEADAVFHQDPRWLGGDLASTIDLGGDRTLWLFGDSFIATSPAHVRTESAFIRNSAAVMTGRDPRTATMQFAWHDGASPSSLLPEADGDWFWPADGVRLSGGPLVVFLNRQRATTGGPFGFASAGFRAVIVQDPSGPPGGWHFAPVTSHDAPYDPAASIACTATDADTNTNTDHLVALVTDGDAHHGRLVRWTLAAVAAADLSQPEWWTESGWRAEAALTTSPAIVIDDGATECSLHRDPSGAWVHVASAGFGATTVAIRTAPALEGPWSDPLDVFTPAESSAPNAFVYAGKAHPMIAGGGLVVTYADNSFTPADLFDPQREGTLYWPHFARLTLMAR